MERVHEDLSQLAKNLDRGPTYALLDLDRTRNPDEIDGLHRYRKGDLVRVPRTGGSWSLGVVADVEETDWVEVLVRSHEGGEPNVKSARCEGRARFEPVKIGDLLQLEASDSGSRGSTMMARCSS